MKPSAPLRSGVTILSPLRYPGAKRRLSSYVAEVLRINSLRPKLFVEPFAGGLSVALQLLDDNCVEKIAVGEKDPRVASFWKTVFNDSQWLIDAINSTPVTLKEWDYFRNTSFRRTRDLALACIFLNRTSFSGILASSAGPIGGRHQLSPHKIDCRFNVNMLTKRIRQAAKLRDRVLFVERGDWRDTISKARKLKFKKNEVFYYLDPPFYNKAERLYPHYFDDKNHRELHDLLSRLKQPWLLSYDKAESIIAMYSHNGYGPTHIDILYSVASASNRPQSQEVVITNLQKLPNETRIWKSKEEWKLKSAPR
ncbi:MAG: DNA adenine methylase [Acidobacteriota bacterium]|nr:DNA adenine methylase [Acidobacteriota bacterium]